MYLVVLFICQRNFLAGAQQCAGNIAQNLNARLGSALPVAQGGSAAQLGLFLLLAALPVTGALAAAALRRADALLLDLMLLPVVVLLALPGPRLLCPPACCFWSVGWGRGRLPARCSGGPCGAGAIPKTTARTFAAIITSKSLPRWRRAGFALCWRCPVGGCCARRWGVPLGWLQPAAQRVESAALSTAITWLPRVSGGRLNIQVEAAAGGGGGWRLEPGRGYPGQRK